MQNCSACHGLHGEGGSGGRLVPAALPRFEIISVTEVGTDGMPGFGSQLSPSQIGAIADHVLGMAGLVENEGESDEGSASTPTTVRSDDRTLAVGSPADSPGGGPVDGGSSPGTVLVIVISCAAAGVAVFLWLRAARNLSG
jgi:hypothetical protein